MNYMRSLVLAALLAAGPYLAVSAGMVADSLSSDNFIELNGGLPNFLFRVQAEKEVTVAFLGGSITAGGGWRDHVMEYLRAEYPDVQFTFINAGIPSLGSVPHSFRLESDVLAKGRIDLLFVESAVNDHVNGTPVVQQRRALEGIIRHARRVQPVMDIVLMAFADETKNAAFAAGTTPQEILLHHAVAKHHNLPFVNLAREVYERINAGEFSWADDFKDLHPSPFGHQLYSHSIGRMFTLAQKRKVHSRLKPARLPKFLDPMSYSHGEYMPVAEIASASGFSIDPSWEPGDGVRTRNGFVRVPMLVGTEGGSSFEIMFTGTAIGIAVVSGPDAGTIAVSIDNGPAHKYDLFTQWSKSLHLPWYLMLEDNLKNGTHRAKVTLLDDQHADATGTACRVVHFLVNKPVTSMVRD